MAAISSQDLRNAYQKFYVAIRRYLWPLETLQDLSDVEVNIYSAFANIPKLRVDLDKVQKSIKDVMKDDKFVAEPFKALQKLVNDRDADVYLRLLRVNETNPSESKQLKIVVEDEEENDENKEEERSNRF